MTMMTLSFKLTGNLSYHFGLRNFRTLPVSLFSYSKSHHVVFIRSKNLKCPICESLCSNEIWNLEHFKKICIWPHVRIHLSHAFWVISYYPAYKWQLFVYYWFISGKGTNVNIMVCCSARSEPDTWLFRGNSCCLVGLDQRFSYHHWLNPILRSQPH